MGIFRQFPYTNFHEINLDWIINEVKRIVKENKEIITDFNELEEYVKNWMQSLNVDEAIKDYIDELLESGRLSEIILAAFNELDERVSDIESEMKKGSIENYYLSHIKVGEDSDAPIIAFNNPVRNAITWLSATNNQGETIVGDFLADEITTTNKSIITGLTHINDATFCNINNEVLFADYEAGSPKLWRANPATLNIIDQVNLDAWEGSSIGQVSFDNEKNIGYITGEVKGNTNYIQCGVINSKYEIVKQFPLYVGLTNNDNNFSWSYTQGSEVINGRFYGLKTCISETLRSNGFIITGIDFENEKIIDSKMIAACDEVQSILVYNNNIYIYGYSNPTGGDAHYTTLIVLSISPINNIIRDITVDESATLNGNGTPNSPYNNLASAIYQIFYTNSKSDIILKTDVIKPIHVTPPYSGYASNYRITGNNVTLNMLSNLTLHRVNIQFNGIIFNQTGSYYWTFTNNSYVSFYDCTFIKTAAIMMFRILTSMCIVNNGAVNFTANNEFGIFQIRWIGLLICEWASITSGVNTNVIANTLGGCVINTRAITALTNPYPQTSNSVKLGN